MDQWHLDIVSPSYIFGAVAVAGFLYLVNVFASLLPQNPLRNVPGPWYIRWTSIVIKYHGLKGNRARYQHDLHLQYGPLVRLSPNEVSTTSLSSIKKIYNARETYRKTPWNKDLSVATEELLNTNHIELHRKLRRLFSGSIKGGAPTPSKGRPCDAEDRKEMERRGAADVIKWFLFMATDIIGELSFEDPFRTLEIGEVSGYTKDLDNLGYMGAVRSGFPTSIAMAKYLPLPFFRRPLQATKNMIRYAEESITRYRNLVNSDPTSVKWTLFTKVFQDSDKVKEALTPVELRANASASLVASSDSTAVALTYLVWSVCRHPAVKAALLEELRTLPSDFTPSHLPGLSYLNQVLDETLRLYSGIQSSLPRLVPDGGDGVAGHWLPQGTTFCAQAYSLHRMASVFPDPDVFDPSRWAVPTREMKDALMPFGNGSRTAKFFLTYPEA
ncbi:putative sterigmatocystin biosynthesis P450 monooxygenase STCB [Trichoderma ghanense]|uniref:Sterigmatocystin biosynthesis P450 monooxygenase STCB n=1 Tax=Trichoderma ghanense TaxID=65468 RepID=A0ABY2GZN9_9HYPO